jgi:hypothetical protein
MWLRQTDFSFFETGTELISVPAKNRNGKTYLTDRCAGSVSSSLNVTFVTEVVG